MAGSHLKKHGINSADDHDYSGIETLKALRVNAEGSALEAFDIIPIRDTFTLTATDMTNKYVELTSDPVENTVRLDIQNGIPQRQVVDFTLVGSSPTRLSWNGLGLDGLLEAGDTLIVIYNA